MYFGDDGNDGVAAEEEEEGVERMTPANSEPAIQGSGGWCWYLPRIWRRSKKFVAVAWTAIRYSVGEGMGSGRVVTVRSWGPCQCELRRHFESWRIGKDYLDVFFYLDGAHFESVDALGR